MNCMRCAPMPAACSSYPSLLAGVSMFKVYSHTFTEQLVSQAGRQAASIYTYVHTYLAGYTVA